MPPENFTISYGKLFSLKILHRYFLNYAAKAFDAAGLSDEEKKIVQIIGRSYDSSRFWQVAPGEATRQTLRDLQLVFRPSADGFSLAVATEENKPLAPLPDELELNFCIFSTDNYFLTYTDIAPEVMNDLMKHDRFFLLSNKATLPDLSANKLHANETIAATDLIDRKDAPLHEFENKKPIGFIRIRHSVAEGISLLSASGKVQPTLTYTITFKNRTTQWQYKETNLGLKPLVQHGLLPVSSGGKELPNPTPATTLFKNDAFYSVIY